MDRSLLQKNTQKLVVQRNVLLGFSTVLVFALFLLVVLLFFKTERTVIVPTNGSPFWIEDGRASSGYLERMGAYLSDILLNRNPADVDQKNQTILEYVHPSAYHEIKKFLLKEKETIAKGNQSFFFRTERSSVDMERNAFIVEGELILFVGKSGEASYCAQREPKKYILHFTCLNGRLLLSALKKEEV